jgi:hypothetical protein
MKLERVAAALSCARLAESSARCRSSVRRRAPFFSAVAAAVSRLQRAIERRLPRPHRRPGLGHFAVDQLLCDFGVVLCQSRRALVALGGVVELAQLAGELLQLVVELARFLRIDLGLRSRLGPQPVDGAKVGLRAKAGAIGRRRNGGKGDDLARAARHRLRACDLRAIGIHHHLHHLRRHQRGGDEERDHWCSLQPLGRLSV